jgi:hypothetical protein
MMGAEVYILLKRSWFFLVRLVRLSMHVGWRAARASAEDTGQVRQPKKRGRKPKFTRAQLEKVRKLKQDGKTNNQAAQFLYGTPAPTDSQRRSISTILRYHFRPKGGFTRDQTK